MRLIRFDEISRPNGEYLWFNDSVMAMFSRNGVTGYDTALQRNEARLFSCFYSPNLQNYRDRTSWLRYGVQSSIVWPEAEGILTVPDSLGPVNQARLQLLGISSLLWERPIGNLEPPHWDARFRLWDHSFPSSSPVSVLPDAGTPDIATLFSHAADATLADRLLRQRLAAPLYFDDKTGRYRAELPQGTGLIAVTYNLPRFYSAFLNGAAVSAEPLGASISVYPEKIARAGDPGVETRNGGNLDQNSHRAIVGMPGYGRAEVDLCKSESTAAIQKVKVHDSPIRGAPLL